MSGNRAGLMELIGIYDADSGLVGEAVYFWGKLIHRRQCSLCDISHHLVRQKVEFQKRSLQIPVPILMLHLNERTPTIVDFTEGKTPCLIARFEDHLELVLSSQELADLRGDESEFFNRINDWLDRR